MYGNSLADDKYLHWIVMMKSMVSCYCTFDALNFHSHETGLHNLVEPLMSSIMQEVADKAKRKNNFR